MERTKETLGIDIGGVVIDRTSDRTDTSFLGNNYLQTAAVDEAFTSVRRLVQRRFGDRVHLVSKCGPTVETKTLQWLRHHRFYAEAGVKLDHVHFCRKRAEKAELCAGLGITHFIDDRLEVLGYLTTVPHRFLFRPTADEIARFAEFLSHVRVVNSWHEVLEVLLSDI